MTRTRLQVEELSARIVPSVTLPPEPSDGGGNR